MYKTDSLTHYGVLGMRWGRRKTNASFEKRPRKEKAKKSKRDLAQRKKDGLKILGTLLALQVTFSGLELHRRYSLIKELERAHERKKYGKDIVDAVWRDL